MEWKSPKLAWFASDKFETDDYNRIKGNAQYLAEQLKTLRGNAPILTVYNVDVAYIPHADFYTNTEKAVVDIRNATKNDGLPFETYYAYSFVWNNIRLQYLERMQLETYFMLREEGKALKRLAFTLTEGDSIF